MALLETVTTLENAAPFSREDLRKIDSLLRGGASLKEILAAFPGEDGEPMAQSTYYWRLKKSGKRAETVTIRRLIDIHGGD